MNKRLITKRQEEALRLCHHDFKSFTQTEAAKIMGVSSRAVCFLLEMVEKVLPQYFPILTKQETKIYHYYMVEGWSVAEIVEYTELSEGDIYKTLKRTQSKGKYFPPAKGKVLSWDQLKEDNNEDDVETFIKHKF